MKLTYFDAYGRGELPRLLLAAVGGEYEDERLSFQEFGQKKGAGTFLFGSVPQLVDGDLRLAQGPAICSYISKKYNFYPDSIGDQALIDAITLDCEDIRMKVYPEVYFNRQDKEEGKKRFQAHAFKKADNLQKLLGEKEFFVAGKLTHADIAVFDILSATKRAVEGTTFPENLEKLVERVGNSEKIKAYLDKRAPSNLGF